jgi:molybdopterin/thiamine biosynthesis adenylyltransferase/rhodanese-related sulfurtransferase
MGRLSEIDVLQARARQQRGELLVDVREPEELPAGMPEGAISLPLSRIEAEAGACLRELAGEHALAGGGCLLLICGSGRRSLRAAEALLGAGLADAASIAGGMQAWNAAGLPKQAPAGTDPAEADFLERYSRHLRLPQVGREGQEKLLRSRIVLVGAGGLGSPAAFYLAAAGVGRLRLVDHDRVDRSNLQRQILHRDDGIGELKVDSAARALSALNPGIRIETVPERLSADNVVSLIADADVVIDGTDNFPARYLLNDACLLAGKPLLYGAVHRFEGQVSLFDAGRRRGEAPCYRCLFPEPPTAEEAPNCAEAGVLGVLPGVIGLLQATEAIKLLLGIGDSLAGRLLHFDALGMRFRETRLKADPDCPTCGTHAGTPRLAEPDMACRAD